MLIKGTLQNFAASIENGSAGPDKDLAELALLVPREVERTTNLVSQLEEDLKAKRSLLQMVGGDLLTGLNENENAASNKRSRVWSAVTEFKLTVESERLRMLSDLHKTESQLAEA